MLDKPMVNKLSPTPGASRHFLLLLAVLILAGCSTTLTIEEFHSQIASDTGLEKSSILKTVPASFTVTSKTIRAGVWRTGAIAISDSELFIYAVDPPDKSIKQVLRLPFLEIKGVSHLAKEDDHQVLLLGVIGIVAIELMDAERNTIDPQASKEIADYIKDKGVPEFSPKRMIGRPLEIPLFLPIIPIPPIL